jgi:membrane-associated protease RseP (regulator of RpoE activity)
MDESIREVAPRFDDLPRRSTTTSAREWRIHGGLFLLTVLSTIFAGMSLVADVPYSEPALRTSIDYVLYLPLSYIYSVGALLKFALSNPDVIVNGATFSASLLAILFSHEMGHYLASRYYGVDATLPYFLPAPPYFVAGTFGAFIKIKSQIPTRRALFDIGLAGPLAGFVVAVPISVIGLATIGAPAVQASGSGIYFNDPLLFRLLARLMGVRLEINSPINPYYMAAWIGLLVTSLNLMPVGQLDGGHGTFAVFGERAHKIIGRTAFVSMALLAVLGFWWHGSPSGFLYTVLLGIMLKVKHPQPPVMEPLGTKRVVIGVLTLIVFALCFWPFPITIK